MNAETPPLQVRELEVLYYGYGGDEIIFILRKEKKCLSRTNKFMPGIYGHLLEPIYFLDQSIFEAIFYRSNHHLGLDKCFELQNEPSYYRSNHHLRFDKRLLKEERFRSNSYDSSKSEVDFELLWRCISKILRTTHMATYTKEFENLNNK